IDDALDYGGTKSALGKNVGDDFHEGKITLPVLLAYKAGSEDERAFWREAMESDRADDADLKRATELLARHGTITETVERARAYGGKAKASLASLPDTPVRDALIEVVDFCISRAH
ncbi:MAG: polyprenyl synthetase family protein, partial [Pseudomonadota bacterium]